MYTYNEGTPKWRGPKDPYESRQPDVADVNCNVEMQQRNSLQALWQFISTLKSTAAISCELSVSCFIYRQPGSHP